MLRLLSVTAFTTLLAACKGQVIDQTASLPGTGGTGGGTWSDWGSGDTTSSGSGTTDPIEPVIPACGRSGEDPGLDDPYGHLLHGMTTSWSGTAKAPYGWLPENWNVDFTFRADGTYSAHCLDDLDDCVALYYGSDDESSEKTWMLDDIQASGLGVGVLQIYFSPGNLNQADLEHIKLSDDLSTLRFEMWKGEYGPVVYELYCVP